MLSLRNFLSYNFLAIPPKRELVAVKRHAHVTDPPPLNLMHP